MSCLPTYCDACERASATESGATAFECAVCGNAQRVLPGASYGAADVPLFDELEAIVYRAQLSRSEASLIAEQIERSSQDVLGWSETLVLLSQRLTGLEAFTRGATVEPARLRRLMGMLLSLVSARKLERTDTGTSGTYSRLNDDLFAKVPVVKGPRKKPRTRTAK